MRSEESATTSSRDEQLVQPEESVAMPQELMEQMIDGMFSTPVRRDASAEADSPLAEIAHEFFTNNWNGFRDGLLERSNIMRVRPLQPVAPTTFYFEFDRPYKCHSPGSDSIEIKAGPIRGTIWYRPNLFEDPEQNYIAVQVDPELHYFHPNCAARYGSMICLGRLPAVPFPLPLDMLIENHLYPILTYQNMAPTDSLNRDAAIYFALAANPMEGLLPVPPLYE